MPRINVPLPIHFQCQKGCANCCKINGGYVLIQPDDVVKIAKYLKISEEAFLKKYTRKEGKQLCLIDKNETDCVFLDEEQCTIYPLRPLQCRTFPFWPQNLKTEKRWFTIMEECPGIGEGRSFNKVEIEEVFKGKPVNSIK